MAIIPTDEHLVKTLTRRIAERKRTLRRYERNAQYYGCGYIAARWEGKANRLRDEINDLESRRVTLILVPD